MIWNRDFLTKAQRRFLQKQHHLRKRSTRGHEARKRGRNGPSGKGSPQVHHEHRVTHLSPQGLSFDEFPEETARWMMRLREIFRANSTSQICIDLRPLEKLGPAAALVLTAEMNRSVMLSPRARCAVYMPLNEGPKDLLGEIGFYRYFSQMRPKWNPKTNQKRFFLEHIHGGGIDREAAVRIVQHLQNHRPKGQEKSALYEALIEGMKNSCEWGYGQEEKGYRLWWALAYRDEESGEMAYCLYDQGRTIPTTIRELRFTLARLKKHGVVLSSSRLVERAVVRGHYSRTGKKNRGTGLPSLKHLIDKAGQGRMVILSREAYLRFSSGQVVAERRDFQKQNQLFGTLVSWLLVPAQPNYHPSHENDLFNR